MPDTLDIRPLTPTRNFCRPIILGVVGDSAAGKTTLTRGIANLLGADRTSVLCTDDYHRYNRQQRKELNITPLNPDCNYMDIMSQHLRLLRVGEPILKPVYEHSIGDFGPPEYVVPQQFIIIEGLLAYSRTDMRNAFDVRVYLDPPEPLRRRWKIKRDTTQRGYTEEEVLRDMDRREPDSSAFIRPQRQHADIVVQFGHERVARLNGSIGDNTDRLDVRLTLRGTLPHPDFSQVLHEAGGANGVRLTLDREHGRAVEHVDIAGDIGDNEAETLENCILQHLEAIDPGLTGELDSSWNNGLTADDLARQHPITLTQLFIVYHLLRTLRVEVMSR